MDSGHYSAFIRRGNDWYAEPFASLVSHAAREPSLSSRAKYALDEVRMHTNNH